MSRRPRVLLAAVVVAGAAVRLFRLDHSSYDVDEILRTSWINGSWRFLWESLTADAVHPPLDYVLGKLVEPLGPTDWARRLLPVLWGTATIAVFARLLARRAGETAALTGAALLALAPYHVRCSQELGPSALGLLLLCSSLLLLDRFLERPRASRFIALFLASLATAYALYAAAGVLALAAATLVGEDAFANDAGRRRTARRFAAWSPVFLAALGLAYLPWWPGLRAAALRAPAATAEISGVGRVLGFFALAPSGDHPPGAAGWLLLALMAAGLWIALATPSLRLFAAWAPGGLAVLAILERTVPPDGPSRFLPAGPGFTALAALALAALIAHPAGRLAGATLLTAVLVLDARSLRAHFREGRADWRPLAEFLRRETGPSERIFAENREAQLRVAYALVGAQWLSETARGEPPERTIVDLEGDDRRLALAWRPGARAWLVLGGSPAAPNLRRWAHGFPSVSFPAAGGAVVHRLDPVAPPTPATPR